MIIITNTSIITITIITTTTTTTTATATATAAAAAVVATTKLFEQYFAIFGDLLSRYILKVHSNIAYIFSV